MFTRNEPHPTDPTKVFLRYRKNGKGERVEQWTTPDVAENRRSYAKQFYVENKESERARGRKYAAENREKELARYRKYNSTPRSRERERALYWKDPDKFRAAKIQQYYKRKRNIIPLVAAHQEQLAAVYRLAADLNYAASGAGATEHFEVDHIWPLCHTDFCGLHAPWNMQILSRHDNASKSNKHPLKL